MVWLSFYSVGISSSSKIFPKSSCSMPAVVYGSALSATGGILSGPAFPDFSFLIALTISSLDGFSQFTSSSDGASGVDGVSVGDGLLSSSRK